MRISHEDHGATSLVALAGDFLEESCEVFASQAASSSSSVAIMRVETVPRGAARTHCRLCEPCYM